MGLTTNETRAWDMVHQVFRAYETKDRSIVERLLADDFRFSSPPDPDLDREQYFERCWPNSESTIKFRFLKVLGTDLELFVTYELEKTDGTRGRNTEFFVVDGDKITKTDVYFGPSL
jgi:ketosteroid isomerase-like protein